MSNHCPQNVCPSIALRPGPQGPEGITGPSGPIGLTGNPGVNLPNNFIALQTQNTDQTIPINAYTELSYDTIAAQQGNDVIVPSLPATTVTLTGGHTYLIAFNTNGLGHNALYRSFYRAIVDGVLVPDRTLDANYSWTSNTDNLSHVWIYQATSDTTLAYAMTTQNGSREATLSGVYLTIITLV